MSILDRRCRVSVLFVTVIFLLPHPCRAADAETNRYFLGLLDHRSTYGTYWFPEPLRGPEMDVDSEFRVDYFHGENADRQQDQVKAEVEYSIGLLTLEMEVPYERESESSFDPTTGQ